jgi:hypothetical protein
MTLLFDIRHPGAAQGRDIFSAVIAGPAGVGLSQHLAKSFLPLRLILNTSLHKTLRLFLFRVSEKLKYHFFKQSIPWEAQKNQAGNFKEDNYLSNEDICAIIT